MVKMLVFSISFVFLFSGCTKQNHAPSDRANRSRANKINSTQATQSSAPPSPTTQSQAPTITAGANTETTSTPAKKPNTDSAATSGSATSLPGTDLGSIATDSANSENTNSTTTSTTDQPAATSKTAPSAANSASQTPDDDDISTAETSNVQNEKAAADLEASEANRNKTGSNADGQLTLTLEETKNLELIMKSELSEKAMNLVTEPMAPKNIDSRDLSVETKGTFEKLTFTVKNKQQTVAELKDLKLSLSGLTKIKTAQSRFLGICVGAKCEVAFVSLYKVENKAVIENYPAILKWTENGYMPAQKLNAQQIQEQTDARGYTSTANLTEEEKIAKAPPQLRVRYLLDMNTDKHFSNLAKKLESRMKKDNSIYSGRFFANVKAGSFDWKLKKQSEGLNLNLKIEFTESEKRAALDFNGLIKDKGARLQDKSGITLDVYHVIPNEFYVMVFENDNFKSQVPDSKKAIQAYLCQVLVDGNESYSECDPMPSAYVLGEWVLEGRIGGPAFVNNGTDGKPIFKEKYTPLSYEEMKKQSKIRN